MIRGKVLLGLGCALLLTLTGCAGLWQSCNCGGGCCCGPTWGPCEADCCGPDCGCPHHPIRDRLEGGCGCGSCCSSCNGCCESCGGGCDCGCGFHPLQWVFGLFKCDSWCGPSCGDPCCGQCGHCDCGSCGGYGCNGYPNGEYAHNGHLDGGDAYSASPNGGYARRTYPANARSNGYANGDYRDQRYVGNASQSRRSEPRPDEPGVISDYGFDPSTRSMADSAQPHRATRPENQ